MARVNLSAKDDIWCLVDADDYDWIIQHNWNWGWHAKTPWKYYAKRNVGRARSTLYLHREIMLRQWPPPMPGMHVDHKNGQSLDNRKCNLHWVTPLQNARNRLERARIPTLDSIVASLGAPAAELAVPF